MSTKILILGGAGYLGSVLTEELLLTHNDCQITVVDDFRHGVPSLAHLMKHFPRLTIIARDLLNIRLIPLVQHADVILPLAALVGEPICRHVDAVAVERINQYIVELVVSFMSKDQQIIFPCTNSGYGVGSNTECTEDQPLKPLSLYGVTKVAAEKAVLSHPNGISLRLATLFGMSPRMRLDLLVNDFVYRAVRDRALILFEPHFRRNFIHVRDAARAFCHAINGGLKPGVYNVGDGRANMTKAALCAEIANQIPEFTWLVSKTLSADPDKRDYLVSNDKLRATGFMCTHTLNEGIQELRRGFSMPFVGPSYRNA